MTEHVDELVRVKKHQCIRIEKSGTRATEVRDSDVVDLWIKFNQDFRPEAALFVDGLCRGVGSFTEEQCANISAALDR